MLVGELKKGQYVKFVLTDGTPLLGEVVKKKDGRATLRPVNARGVRMLAKRREVTDDDGNIMELNGRALY